MMTPSVDEFCEIANELSSGIHVIPVYQEIYADLDTPLSAFLKCAQGDHAFLLESAEGGERWGRYSFIGMDPELVVRATGTHCELLKDGAVVRADDRADPLQFLEEQMARFTRVDVPGLPRFAGGAVGWLGYDAIRWWERLPERRNLKPTHVPTMLFAVPRTLLAFDNLRHRMMVTRLVFHVPGSDARRAYEESAAEIKRLIAKLRGPLPESPPACTAPAISGVDARAYYENAVRRIKEYIAAGDCIQVVPSRRFKFAYDGPPFDFYRALRTVNPSPYMFYLKYGDIDVVGASPEVLVRVENREMMVAPIAGTRRRSANDIEDRAIEEELLADPKERAEHVMLVDLARNDLGRVGVVGSVRVDNFMHVQRYSHVMHIVSEVRAKLLPGKTQYDAVRSTFPAGTLSGAPKVRAMQIIDELEPISRELYGGAVGYFGFDGNVDLCIAIRTAWRKGSEWNLQVGGGIVADSEPEAEYLETVNKAGGVLRALEVAKEGF